MAKSVRPLSWLKQVALGLGALGTVIFTAQHVRPVYAGRAPVVRELLEQARIAPGHYRRAQRSWLEAAQRLLQS